MACSQTIESKLAREITAKAKRKSIGDYIDNTFYWVDSPPRNMIELVPNYMAKLVVYPILGAIGLIAVPWYLFGALADDEDDGPDGDFGDGPL